MLFSVKHQYEIVIGIHIFKCACLHFEIKHSDMMWCLDRIESKISYSLLNSTYSSPLMNYLESFKKSLWWEPRQYILWILESCRSRLAQKVDSYQHHCHICFGHKWQLRPGWIPWILGTRCLRIFSLGLKFSKCTQRVGDIEANAEITYSIVSGMNMENSARL